MADDAEGDMCEWERVEEIEGEVEEDDDLGCVWVRVRE